MPRLLHRVMLAIAGLLVAGAVAASGHPLDVTDIDHDGWKNFADNCPNNYNPKQTDTDGDTPAPVLDPGLEHPQTGPVLVYPFTEGQGLPTDRPPDVGGDACDDDDDNDGVTDNPKRDNCRLVANPDQTDSDFDGMGDACDPDDDNDGVPDDLDNCPLTSNAGQRDGDGDGVGDACDPDGPKAGSTLAGGDPNDRTAPAVKLQLPKRMLVAELGRGLAVGVRCSEGCVLEGELLLGGRRIGRGAAQVERRGFTWVFVELARGTERRLARAGRARARLRVSARDANGNRRVATRRVLLRG